ncbi:hypothetical protein [Sphingomonas sp.]|uniref:alpha/beta hydrolase family protein n=1 Tax=Sphingomonas sp. TaxID=28214 RepID=UPI001EC3E985|nr:hypothetical protein [Sphingomonas sp.]MBX3595824.1 hypothetical protein [Sphingomonas sp.]
MTSRLRRFALPLAAPLILGLGGCATSVSDTAPPAAAATLSPAEALKAKAAAGGATDLVASEGPDGGTILGGKLDGQQFALAFPAGWNGGEGLVYAHGYSTPGTPVEVAANPVGDKSPSKTMGFAYADGVAVGHSAYAKDGLGVETGIKSTKRLRDLLASMGAGKVYAVGDSMGGGIVEALLEMYPGQFAGGVARCGVVDDWSTLVAQLYDMRASYNFLTKGTPYALPGEQDIRVSALPVATNQAEVWGQFMRMGAPVIALFNAAGKNPSGPEARIIRQVAAIGGFEPDPGALAFPLLTASLGASDIAATAGGQPYDNTGKVYASDTMTAAEAKALNAGIQRVSANPAAVAYLARWHRATGRISDPLVTMHNTIDSLVPYAQETALEAKVKASGRSQYLASYGVPPQRMPLPIGGVEAYTHCGFTPEQSKAAWEALHGWVRTGKRPAASAVK